MNGLYEYYKFPIFNTFGEQLAVYVIIYVPTNMQNNGKRYRKIVCIIQETNVYRNISFFSKHAKVQKMFKRVL